MSGKRVIELAGAAAGILGIPGLVFIFTSSVEVTAISTGALAALVLSLFLVDAIPEWRPPTFFRRFGIRQYRGRFSVPEKREVVTIADDYTATISTRKKFCFHKAPKPRDLVDIIEVHPGHELEDHEYSAENCRITEIRRPLDHLVAIYWEPLKQIQIGEPFWHKYSYICRDENAYGPGVFWQGYMVDVQTNLCAWTFHCPVEVERVYAFEMSRFGSRWTPRHLWNLGERKKLRNCVQPDVARDRRTIKWALKNPQYGASYVLIAVYPGGQHALDAWRHASD